MTSLRVPWTARRSNQSILKEISPEYSLERLMLKLKLQYFGDLMWRTDSLKQTLMLVKNLPTMQETWIRSLGWEDPLEKGMATHSSILAWRIPWTIHFHALEKEMATHSSVLAWRIPGTEEPSGLLSMGLHRVGHNWGDLAAAAAAYSPWGHKDSDTTKRLSLSMLNYWKNKKRKKITILDQKKLKR